MPGQISPRERIRGKLGGAGVRILGGIGQTVGMIAHGQRTPIVGAIRSFLDHRFQLGELILDDRLQLRAGDHGIRPACPRRAGISRLRSFDRSRIRRLSNALGPCGFTVFPMLRRHRMGRDRSPANPLVHRVLRMRMRSVPGPGAPPGWHWAYRWRTAWLAACTPPARQAESRTPAQRLPREARTRTREWSQPYS
jgi:hypothetical protein